MNVARIAYTNTEPFFHYWNSPEFKLKPGSPKSLADDAKKKGDIIAGPLPLVECWALDDRYEPLGNWGISSRERCRSVYVFSQIPFAEIDHASMGVTKESATSVVLCETLIRQKYGNDVRMRKGLQMTDTAWLVIGDQALQLAHSPLSQAWPYVTDLATEWWNWQRKPFVFAQWVVRKDVAGDVRAGLSRTIEKSLEKGIDHISEIAADVAPRLKISPAFVKSYLSEFIYELGDDARESAQLFRQLVQKGAPRDIRAVAAH